MDRRRFIKSVTGAATVAAAGHASAAQPATSLISSHSDSGQTGEHVNQRVLRVGISGPDGVQGHGDFVQQLAARVRAASNQALSLDVVGSVDDGADAIKRGDIACFCASDDGLMDEVPELSFFSGLPGKLGLAPEALHSWLTHAGGQSYWDEIAGDFNIKPLAIAHTGPVSYLWSRRPIARVEDFSGKTVFATGLTGDVVRGLGATPLAGGLNALQRAVAAGTGVAADVGNLPMALAAGLPQNLKYASTPGLIGAGRVVTLAINRPVWDSLPESEQTLLETAAAAVYHETVGFAQTHHTLMVDACRQRFSTEFSNLPKDVTGAIGRIADAIVAHLAASSPRAARINTSYMSFRKSIGLLS